MFTALHVCLSVSVCGLYTTMRLAKTDEPIKMPFGRQTDVDPRSHALDGGAYGRYLANIINDQKRQQCGFLATAL